MAEVATTENEQKLLKQIEFYFGDANLPFDRFIKLQCAQNDGWFPLPTLLKFNRVRSFTDDLSSDDQRLKKIEEVLKGSVLVEVSESGDKIRRNPEMPLPEGNSEERSVYIKGFHKTETKINQLIDHFSKYEGFEAVVMRYYKEKVIISTPIENGGSELKPKVEAGTKGTSTTIKTEAIETEIKPTSTTIKTEADETESKPASTTTKIEADETEASATVKTEAVETESKPTLTEKSPPVETKPTIKIIPTEDKIAWHKKFKGSIFVVFNSVENAEKLLSDKEFSYPGNQVPYIKMTQKQYKEKKKSEFEERQSYRKNKADGIEPAVKKQKEDVKDEKELATVAVEALKDVLVKVTTIPEGFTREILKAKWYAVAPEDKFSIAFIDFQRGDTSGVLRLEREGAAKEAIELLSGTLTLGENVSSTIERLEGEEEEKYNKKVAEERAKMKRKAGFGGRGGGRGRGRGGKRGRRY